MVTNNSGDYAPVQYNIQVGGANGTLANIAPSTAGQIFQSGGASANPVFSTATYPTTAGTSGNVLTSDGTNFISQTPASVSFAPNSTIQISDDFISYNRSATLAYSQLGYTITSNAWRSYTTGVTSGNPGVISNQASASVFSIFAGAPSDGLPIILGGGAISINWVVKMAVLSASSPRYTFQCGLADTTSSSTQVNGVYFQYSDNLNSGDWVGTCTSASSSTSANSAITVVNNAFVNLGITVNAAATSVAFFVNGTQIANSPITTNIPTTAINPFVLVNPSVGTTAVNSVLIDLFYISQTLTTPR